MERSLRMFCFLVTEGETNCFLRRWRFICKDKKISVAEGENVKVQKNVTNLMVELSRI